MAAEIAADGGTNGRMEGTFAKLGEKPEALELVFDGVFEFGEAQLDSGLVQSLIQFGEGIGRSDVHAGDRFCGNDQPARRSWRFRRGVQNTFLEQLGIGEEQRCIPTKEDQAGYLTRAA